MRPCKESWCAERAAAPRRHVHPKGVQETLTGGGDAWPFEAEFCRECNRSTRAGMMGRAVPVRQAAKKGVREIRDPFLTFFHVVTQSSPATPRGKQEILGPLRL